MKIRYGFLTNSSSSSFVIKAHPAFEWDREKQTYVETQEAIPYTKEEFIDILKKFFTAYRAATGQNGMRYGKDWEVFDTKDPEEIANIFSDWAYWGVENRGDCLLDGGYYGRTKRELGIEDCETCPLVSKCKTDLDYILEGDVFMISAENAIPEQALRAFLKDALYRDLIWSAHLG